MEVRSWPWCWKKENVYLTGDSGGQGRDYPVSMGTKVWEQRGPEKGPTRLITEPPNTEQPGHTSHRPGAGTFLLIFILKMKNQGVERVSDLYECSGTEVCIDTLCSGLGGEGVP